MIRRTNLLLATVASLSLSLQAQQIAEGYSSDTNTLANGAGNVLETAFGTVSFDGLELTLTSSNGTQTLLTFPSNTFGSFTAPIGANRVLFGESSNDGIWSVPLNGGTPQLVANVLFNYDAVLLDDDRALVSAKTGGFSSPDNEVMFVDLLTGQTQLLAQFPGASGPLAIDAAGDVYYATASATFPAPPGTADVLRLSRATVDAAILNNQVLGTGDATVVIQGLDAAGDLAFDDDGDLFYVDWMNGAIGEINGASSSQASLGPVLVDFAGSGVSGSGLQFVASSAPGDQVFEPFQFAGGTLYVRSGSWSTGASQNQGLRAAPPALTSSAPATIPSGAFSLDTTGGPANGFGLLLFATGPASGSVTLPIPGLEASLLLSASLANSAVMVPLPLDASGAASLNLNNPGFAPILTAHAQTVVLSTSGAIGSAATLPLQVGQ
jgi:hypothetical protein